jgi:indolepyruvate ferredoxin oxidoreductase beta subunit
MNPETADARWNGPVSGTDGVTSIVLVGVGGQGILLATQIAARAAMFAGFDVKTNEVHGMAQRGGSVVAEIRYGEKVASPLVPQGTARVLASLERIEALRYAGLLAPDGLAVVSSQAIVPVTVSLGKAGYPSDARERLSRVFPRLIYVDAVGIAEKLCDIRTANVVVLGAMSTALPLDESCWQKAIARCVKAKYVDLNLRAFQEGRGLSPRSG